MREALKQAVRALALILVAPALASFWIRAALLGQDRALESSSQTLSLIPGIAGQYLRQAFLARVLAGCHPTSTVSFGTLFSQCGARLDEYVYVGPRCSLGLVHIERDVLLGAGVHVTSGRHTHGADELDVPIRHQPTTRTLVRIGAGTWIGSGAIIMADVGQRCVIGAGSVVTKPVPDDVVAAGVPARVIRQRASV
ncbi:MAG TPA: acyltransferase [Vicinamibacterales bacterium]|jgi:acetyltransferase-like isoleucine patch superfamily enzyme|nr:acyltransferase [Vicinamibacterales bacterium]